MVIALLLGSFNPIHNGHLAIARYVIEQRLADKVWFVVSPQNPFKSSNELAPFEHRVAMAKLAITQINGRSEYQVCDIEQSLPRPSYTINTLRKLKELHPQDEFIILCGSDIADQIDRWRESQQLQSMAQLLIYPRSEGTASAQMADAPQFDIAATELRNLIHSGNSAQEYIPQPVAQYIDNNQLYVNK